MVGDGHLMTNGWTPTTEQGEIQAGGGVRDPVRVVVVRTWRDPDENGSLDPTETVLAQASLQDPCTGAVDAAARRLERAKAAAGTRAGAGGAQPAVASSASACIASRKGAYSDADSACRSS